MNMVNTLHSITQYTILVFVLLILITIAGFVLFILHRKKQPTYKEVDYSSFDKKDSLEYLKFDDIVGSSQNKNEDDSEEMGVIVQDGGKKFTAIIAVNGFDFYAADYNEQVVTINSMISFMDALEMPVTFRQTSKAIDIQHNIEVHEEIGEKLNTEIRNLNEQRDILVVNAEDNIDDAEAYDLYTAEIEKLNTKIELLKMQLAEDMALINYMKAISSRANNAQEIKQIIITYTHDPNQFTAQLTKEEIYMNAMQSLKSQAAAMFSGLARCNCSGKLFTAEELIDLLRRHNHPVTSDDVSLEELFNSSLTELCVTSDSLLEALVAKITKEEYERKMKQLNAQVDENNKRAALIAEKAEKDRLSRLQSTAESMVTI